MATSPQPLDRQAILEASIMAIVTQGGPSANGDRCQYRGPHGRKCPIGHLVADEYYSPSMEGEPFCDTDAAIQAVEKTLGVQLTHKDIGFLQSLQEAHDLAYNSKVNVFFEPWSNRLQDVCKTWSLRFPEELI